MSGAFWWIWIVFLVVFLVSPISYGWAYRGWGPPYPSYFQRRRGERFAGTGGLAFDHNAWGWAGDFVWAALLLWVLFAFFVPWR